jgi:hypothetical protein
MDLPIPLGLRREVASTSQELMSRVDRDWTIGPLLTIVRRSLAVKKGWSLIVPLLPRIVILLTTREPVSRP